MPREQLITALIVSMLLKLSGDNQIVSFFFSLWQDFFEPIKQTPATNASLQLQVENEDDLKIANKIARLYGLKDKRLPPKGLKMLF
jgi:hypothetical protein